MMIASPLETPQLVLRTLDRGHAAGPYLGWMADPEILRFLEARFSTHDEASLVGFIKGVNASPDSLLLGMFLRGEDRHVGNIKLGPVNRQHERADIGLVIGDRSVWGRGLATEAIAALADYAFGPLGLHRLTAGCYASNLGSMKAFQKAGFQLEARLPQHWRNDDGAWEDHVAMGRLAQA